MHTPLTLTSPAFAQGEPIPIRHTCDGNDTSPPLAIAGVPAAARSLALIVEDPDAPAGIWTHWLVWNLDPAMSVIPEATVPPGSSQGMTNFRRREYNGPCPPSGRHRYFFRLFALDRRLELGSDTTRLPLLAAMRGHIITQTELMGTYRR